MYTVSFAHEFKKNYKVLLQNKPTISDKVESFLLYMQKDGKLPASFKDHALK
jgi:mRNA-degrading endonuclease YafQ of YafQ-DinJ toxin-antitoxin module